MITPRPASLAQVASRTVDARSFEFELADFLHEFALRGAPDMLADSPEFLRDRCTKGTIYDAYLAAVAVHLSGTIGARAPAWPREPDRILQEPWFSSPGRHMRALLLVESPAAFRERNLFVTANALSVA